MRCMRRSLEDWVKTWGVTFTPMTCKSATIASPTPVASATTGVSPTLPLILALVTAHGACQRSRKATLR